MHSSQSRCIRNEELVDSAQCTAVRSIDVKSVQIKTKYVKKRKKRDEFLKKTFVNVIKNVTSSQCISTPRLMPKKWPSRQLGICHSV